MTPVLLPRLSRLGVEEVLSSLRRRSKVSSILKDLQTDPNRAGVSFSATGGRRIGAQRIVELREEITQIAARHGYPSEVTAHDRQLFDAACAVHLAESADLQSGELLRDDVWAFIAAVLLLNVTIWRFPTLTPDRFHGGDRNMFQRLWYRAIALDRGSQHPQRWGLIAHLTEDAIAQVVERPSVRNDRRLAVAIAEGWLRMVAGAGGASVERIMRRTIRDLRMRNEIQLLSALPDKELSMLVDEHFTRSQNVEGQNAEKLEATLEYPMWMGIARR